jgi:hypothetical protein
MRPGLSLEEALAPGPLASRMGLSGGRRESALHSEDIHALLLLHASGSFVPFASAAASIAPSELGVHQPRCRDGRGVGLFG